MAWVWLVILIFVLAASATAAWATWRAAPFVPTRQRDVERMVRLANMQADDLLYDLGCGDGRFLITAVRQTGGRAIGFEISLLPYVVAKLRLALSRMDNQASVRWQDFLQIDLSAATVIVCFLTPGAMKKLAPKLRQELRPGTRIVSYAFALPDWRPVIKDKPDIGTPAAWVYQV